MSVKFCPEVFITIVFVFSVCPNEALVYQYHQHPQLQLHQHPAYFASQQYLAVPGRIVHHIAEAPLPVRQITPFRRASQSPQLYYEAENENNNDNGGENSDSSTDPPPMSAPPPPPPQESDSSSSKTKRIHKHISIHVPPEEMNSREQETTIIRPKLDQPEKHVNIIFIKAPTPDSAKKKTEIILPESPEQKTIVYVLVKKIDKPEDLIRVRGPAPTSPPKPQVYYIRYKTKPDDGNNDVYRTYNGKYA
ncbi:unnamed protein product [Orchesella dallaii]|uniref:DUF243 domain-containing protein n=1 Tax=Orchesella dallaii TaxID=48710 RepID=A0ABP1RWR6_9HEXA